MTEQSGFPKVPNVIVWSMILLGPTRSHKDVVILPSALYSDYITAARTLRREHRQGIYISRVDGKQILYITCTCLVGPFRPRPPPRATVISPLPPLLSTLLEAVSAPEVYTLPPTTNENTHTHTTVGKPLCLIMQPTKRISTPSVKYDNDAIKIRLDKRTYPVCTGHCNNLHGVRSKVRSTKAS